MDLSCSNYCRETWKQKKKQTSTNKLSKNNQKLKNNRKIKAMENITPTMDNYSRNG